MSVHFLSLLNRLPIVFELPSGFFWGGVGGVCANVTEIRQPNVAYLDYSTSDQSLLSSFLEDCALVPSIYDLPFSGFPQVLKAHKNP